MEISPTLDCAMRYMMQKDIFVFRVVPCVVRDSKVQVVRKVSEFTPLHVLITFSCVNLVDSYVFLSVVDTPICFSMRHTLIRIHRDERRRNPISPIEMPLDLAAQPPIMVSEINPSFPIVCKYTRSALVSGTRFVIFDSKEYVGSHDSVPVGGVSCGSCKRWLV